MKSVFAQSLGVGNQTINGPLDPSLQSVGDIVTRVTDFLIPIGAVILFFVLIWGGYDYMFSQGVPEKMKAGQQKITTGVVGFVMLLFAYLFTKFIAVLMGLESSMF